MITTISNSKAASRVLSIIKMSEEPYDNEDITNGIYIGKTQVYKIPFLLNLEKLLNRHIAIVGMTGSGKTYFIKSIITRYMLEQASDILIIDWNGEYTDTVSTLSGTINIHEPNPAANPPNDFGKNEKKTTQALFNGLLSINLSRLRSTSEKGAAANTILKNILEHMRTGKPSTKHYHMIVLDEAWKLLNDFDMLNQLFREGRKYGFGVIVSTQLANDINNVILGNAACIVIFRQGRREDIDMLKGSGALADDLPSELPQGSCIVSLAYKHAHIQKQFVIEKVDGFMIKELYVKCGSMKISIPERVFAGVTENLSISNDLKGRIFTFVEDCDRSIDLAGLIQLLLGIGLDRPTIVKYLRNLGIDDLNMVRAYETAKNFKK